MAVSISSTFSMPQAQSAGFTGEVLAGGMEKVLEIQTAIPAAEGKLARAGLLVINPPYGFDTGMEQAASLIAPRLAAAISVKWLAGAP